MATLSVTEATPSPESLAESLAGAAREASRRGFSVMRGWHGEAAGLESLMATLGTLTFTPGERPLPGCPHVFLVSNRGRTVPPRSVFHSDTSYVERPPSYTLLAAVEIPASGGETVFVDQFAAFESADPALKSALAGVEFHHVPSRVPDPDAAGAGCWHPVLRRHPDSGRTALYVSARERLAGARRHGARLGEAEAEDLIEAAHAQGTGGAPTLRHRWRPGELLLTDNRSTLHAADHSSVEGVRTLYRVMVRGERPVAAGTVSGGAAASTR